MQTLKKNCPRAAAILLSLMMVVVFVPTFTFAAEGDSITVSASVSIAGEQKVIDEDVSVTDLNNDNVLTIEDALIAVHAKYSANGAGDFAWEESQYGKGIVKFWGIDTSDVGYYLNNEMAMGLDDPVKTGDELYAYTFKNPYPAVDTDTYSFFDKKNDTVYLGETLELRLTYIGFDADFKPVPTPCEGAAVGYYDGKNFVELGKTDKDGKVPLTFNTVGNYVLTAVGPEGTTLVPPYCKVSAELEPVTVAASVSIAGDLVVVGEEVSVADLNNDGLFTIEDALIAVHAEYSPNGESDFAWTPGDYGKYIVKFWGIDTSDVGYYLNDKMAMGLDDPVKTGDELYAYTFKNPYPAADTDTYSFFDKKSASSAVGKTVKLTLTYTGFDADYNPVLTPCEGAAVGYYSGGKFVKLGTTDANGNATVKMNKAGDIVLTAIGPEGKTLVPPYCKADVAKGAQPMKVKFSNKTYKVKNLKKAKKSYKAVNVTKNQGKVSYRVTYKNKKSKKALSFSKGKVTVKKGTKKGTYKLTVKVTAKGNANYKSGSKSKLITITVK